MSSHLLRKVSRKKTSTDPAVEEVLKNKVKTLEEKLDQSISYRGPGTFSINPPSCQGSVEIAIRAKLKSSTDSQVSRRYRGGVEIA